MDQKLRELHRLATLGTLTGGLCHDLNNLMTPMLLSLELARQEAPPGSRFRQTLGSSICAVESMRHLVRQSMEILRDDPQLIPHPLTDLLCRSLDFIGPLLPGSVSLRRRLQAVRDTVATNPGLIGQLLLNLVLNGAQALGGTRGAVEVALEDEETPDRSAPPFVRLSVRDTGCGMSREVVANIFQPFFTTRGAQGGTGLGLTMVHDIVALHGGEISVESSPGLGTCFVVRLPRVADAVAAGGAFA